METLQSPLARGGTIRRSGTRKGANGAPKRVKGYDNVHQSLKQLHPAEDKEGERSDIDLVFVPGLGAHPEESWQSNKTGFSWIKSEDGIVKDFPRARVLLFMYESVWAGSLKVKQQFMDNIAASLLVCLRSKRKTCKARPIVFIGHSMGGLVIAKAISMANQRRDLYPGIFETTSATIFFGTPFKGTDFGLWATAYAREAEKTGDALSSKLLDFISPGNEALRELRQEFTQLVVKLSPKIQVVCFWEQEPTDFTKLGNLAGHTDATRSLVPIGMADFVTAESAVLDGAETQGLNSDHRNLVKFDGPKDDAWRQIVRERIKPVIVEAPRTCKSRLAAAGGIDLSVIKGLMDAIGGTPVEKKRIELAKSVNPSSWLTKAAEYSQWLRSADAPNDETAPQEPSVDCIWVRAREGRGKTGATISALNNVEEYVSKQTSEQDAMLFAYFFCEPAAEFSTAEDLLKSILSQLINQQPRLATYAKMFIKGKSHAPENTGKSHREGTSKSQAQPTVENLWQCLQDMLSDECVGRCVYLIINNLHVLPEDSDSTIKLMDYMQRSLHNTFARQYDPDESIISTKWFITSRDTQVLRKILGIPKVRLVDLENAKYGDQVQMDLRRHARERVAALQSKKNYNKALAYFASSLIGQHAQNIHWIDITCIQLEELSESESHLQVRRVLEETPQDLSDLLNDAWRQIFHASIDNDQRIKEMLRALILTFEDPTVKELFILAGLEPSATEDPEEALHALIDQCRPFLVVDQTVNFMNPAVRVHLQQNSHDLLGLTDEVIRWEHGVLALRCLSHIKDMIALIDSEISSDTPRSAESSTGDHGDELPPVNETQQIEGGIEYDGAQSEEDSGRGGDNAFDNGNDSGTEVDESDDDSLQFDDGSSSEGGYDEMEWEMDELEYLTEPYPVKHWLHHGSKATAEFADDLSGDEIWEPNSPILRRWLLAYTRMTKDFQDFEPESFHALHVAASIGFRQLVTSLIDNGHEDEMHQYDSLGNTPLHLAAYFGRPNIVQELLDRGAEVDKRELDDDTPLHMAAENGNVDVMKKLIFHDADPNAYSEFSGLVINSAISSGKVDAIKLLVDKGVSLTPEDSDTTSSPLAQAAAMSDNSVLKYLMQEYADQLPPGEYSKALSSAAGAGRMETFKELLSMQHSASDIQNAMDRAAKKAKWDIVTYVLEQHSGLNCDESFYRAAIGFENKDDALESLWQYSQFGITDLVRDRSLYVATDREKYDTVKVLLEKFEADSNATGKTYGNALTAAAYDGTIDIVKLLLDHGADVNSQDGWAIQTAARQGHLQVVQELIDRGANVNACTTNPRFPEGTALQASTEAGREDVVSLLLQNDADPNRGGGARAPPILAAAMCAEEGILDMLIDAKAEVNVVGGRDKSTPLANTAGSIPGTDSLRKLLDAGADINATGGDGETALIAAAEVGDDEVVKFLLGNGADVMYTTEDGTNALKAACYSDSQECMAILVDHISSILSAIKRAMDSGDMAVTAIVRSATAATQGLDYGGPESTEDTASDAQGQQGLSIHEECDASLKERESFHVQIRDQMRTFDDGLHSTDHSEVNTTPGPRQISSHDELFLGNAPVRSTYQQMPSLPGASRISPEPGSGHHEQAIHSHAHWPHHAQWEVGINNQPITPDSRLSPPQPQNPKVLPKRKPVQQPASPPAQGPQSSFINSAPISYGPYVPGPEAARDGRGGPRPSGQQPGYNPSTYDRQSAPMALNTNPEQHQPQGSYMNGQRPQVGTAQPQYQGTASYDGNSWSQSQPSFPRYDSGVSGTAPALHQYGSVNGQPHFSTPPGPPPRPPPVQQSQSSPAMIQQYRATDYAQHTPKQQYGPKYEAGQGASTIHQQHPQQSNNAGGAPRPSPLANFYSRFRRD